MSQAVREAVAADTVYGGQPWLAGLTVEQQGQGGREGTERGTASDGAGGTSGEGGMDAEAVGSTRAEDGVGGGADMTAAEAEGEVCTAEGQRGEQSAEGTTPAAVGKARWRRGGERERRRARWREEQFGELSLIHISEPTRPY